MFFEIGVTILAAAAGVVALTAYSAVQDLQRATLKTEARLRDEDGKLARRLGDIKRHLCIEFSDDGYPFLRDYERLPATLANIKEVREELARLVEALGLVRVDGKVVPPTYAPKGGPEKGE